VVVILGVIVGVRAVTGWVAILVEQKATETTGADWLVLGVVQKARGVGSWEVESLGALMAWAGARVGVGEVVTAGSGATVVERVVVDRAVATVVAMAVVVMAAVEKEAEVRVAAYCAARNRHSRCRGDTTGPYHICRRGSPLRSLGKRHRWQMRMYSNTTLVWWAGKGGVQEVVVTVGSGSACHSLCNPCQLRIAQARQRVASGSQPRHPGISRL
jgi:hypothetical protein